jgi:hypothetical protein
MSKPTLLFATRLIPFLLMALQLCTPAKSQIKKDTLYYDDNWDICEMPIASYMRICTLNKKDTIYFKNEVTDLRMDSTTVMTGSYSPYGKKNGLFTYYDSTGTIRRRGRFENDEMTGKWAFYDKKGALYFEIICSSSNNFTPVFFVNIAGDTLVKNGTGKFYLETKDYPWVFHQSTNYAIEGECADTVKLGTWNYYDFIKEKRLFVTEIYEKGAFRKGHEYTLLGDHNKMHAPFSLLQLAPGTLAYTERFRYNRVFGSNFDDDALRRFYAFLLNGTIPVMDAGSTSFNTNLQAFADQLDELITSKKLGLRYASITSPSKRDEVGNGAVEVATVRQPSKGQVKDSSYEMVNLKDVHIDCTLTISPETRMISSLKVEGNFKQKDLILLYYYLRRLANLTPKDTGPGAKEPFHVYMYTQDFSEIKNGRSVKTTNFLASYHDKPAF